MATGHYARIRKDAKGKYELLRAVDPAKDQSYVLHVLTQDKLHQALFPVGEYPKDEIRRLAAEFGLPTAARADSQDLCFLAGEDYRNFLKRNAAEMPGAGDIVTPAGQVIGRHNGFANYTIGQRKGLGLASHVPLYVITKQTADNLLVVGPREQLGSLRLTARDVNWISGFSPLEPFRAQVKTRYTARAAEALVIPLEANQAEARFEAPVRGVTAGQAAVFYQGEVMVGGGIIQQES
jgi:tRNA-specific 2-thiouridylase